eukprot:GHVS01069658.1.p1 GENE.GHVS01069658.1~~GHVS01069658.1.p1  ORF type:complete len:230 (-),score=26.74 GHVS01069658.1:467-1156(-)
MLPKPLFSFHLSYPFSLISPHQAVLLHMAMWDTTQNDDFALEEYEQAVFSEPPPVVRTEGNKEPDKESATSLLAIRRRDKAELEDSRDEGHLKRFRIVNYTSEDSEVGLSEAKLRTYYCAVCGCHALIVDADLLDLPTRSTDAAIALRRNQFFHKLYLDKLDTIYLNRGNGAERQQRYGCKDCGFPLAYTPAEDLACSEYTYLYPDGLVSEQSKASALQQDHPRLVTTL